MSMTGSENEETNSKSSEKPSEPSKTSESPTESTLAFNHPSRSLTPMLGVFGRKELLPSLLEYEKALLVCKEHSYALKPDRAEVLHLASIQASELKNTSEEHDDMNSVLNARTELLQLRQSYSAERSEPSVVCHLRQLVALQTALIRGQQEKLHDKDKELNAVKKEKEQLDARLERMERRLAILQKRSRLKDPDSNATDSPLTSPTNPGAPNSLVTPVRHMTRRESLMASDARSRSASVEPGVRSRSGNLSRGGSPSKDADSVKRSLKRKSRDADSEEKIPRKRAKQLRELRTEFEYRGLDLKVPKQIFRSISEASPLPSNTGSNPSPLPSNSLANPSPLACNSGAGTPLSEASCLDTVGIVTPSWRSYTCTSTAGEPTGNEADSEDLTDDVFNRRHKKPEEEEKRRKRWDMQRARTLREHNELLRKYNMKGGVEKKETEKPLSSFTPDLSNIDTIEVMDTVTVSAFGRPLPVIKPSEFELPWFDIDVREAKESVRTTRSKARNNRQSVGGSADES